jgi:hypothetical protein
MSLYLIGLMKLATLSHISEHYGKRTVRMDALPGICPDFLHSSPGSSVPTYSFFRSQIIYHSSGKPPLPRGGTSITFHIGLTAHQPVRPGLNLVCLP